MKNIYLITLLVICSILVGCGPVYQTSYLFKPPTTENGRNCANRCLSKQQECYHQCQNITAQCESRKEVANLAEALVESWKKSSLSTDKPHNPSATRYRSHQTDCQKDEQKCMSRCDSIHRLCHENCGGVVIREVTCIRNCDKI